MRNPDNQASGADIGRLASSLITAMKSLTPRLRGTHGCCVKSEKWLVVAVLALAPVRSDARSGGYELLQTITTADVPEAERFPQAGLFGQHLSVAREWCAISHSLDQDSKVHLFHWERRFPSGSGTWEWRQTLHGLAGDLHLHTQTLIACRDDFGGVQEYRLERDHWLQSGGPIGGWFGPMAFEGDAGKLVATLASPFVTGPRDLWALDFSHNKGWQVERITSVESGSNFHCDRDGRRVIVGGDYFGEVLKEFTREKSVWTQSASLEIDPPGGLYWLASPGFQRFVLWRGSVVGLQSYTDFLGNPLEGPSQMTVYQQRAGRFRPVATRETRGYPWGIAAAGGSVILYGSPTDFLGNPTKGELEVYGYFLNPVQTPYTDAQVVAADGRWLVVSDATEDFMGNSVGGTVRIFRR